MPLHRQEVALSAHSEQKSQGAFLNLTMQSIVWMDREMMIDEWRKGEGNKKEEGEEEEGENR